MLFTLRGLPEAILDTDSLDVELQDGVSTVADGLQYLAGLDSELHRGIYASPGVVRRCCRVLVNGRVAEPSVVLQKDDYVVTAWGWACDG